MNSIIKKVLIKLEKNGFEAYVVGGYVRDYMLNISSTDIDICTNALPKEIIKIFNAKASHISYGSISLSDGKYNFDITTFRKESNYDKRVPQKIEYVNNLEPDIKRRDFTINSLCMNSKGEIIDLLGGISDLNKKLIKVVGNTEKKLKEDPLRMLRAIRFSIILGFKLDPEIIKVIKCNKHLVKTLSYTRKQEELNRIFASKNIKVGLNLLKKLDLCDVLEISCNNKLVEVSDVWGIWAQLKYSDNYIFTKSSTEVIKNIRKIVERGKIDNYVLFNNALYVTRIAGEILGYDYKKMLKLYEKLPIKSTKDLNISSKDIFNILEIKPSPKVKEILEDIVKAVLNNKINNNYEEINMYILNKWK